MNLSKLIINGNFDTDFYFINWYLLYLTLHHFCT